MANHFDKRLDPTKLVEGSKTIISLLYNYYPEVQQPKDATYKISKYAYGKDYHKVVKKKLNALIEHIKTLTSQDIIIRGFVDSAPILEKAWAQKSGLGWVGKNGNLINKKKGSFFFLAEIITDVIIEPDNPFKTDHCGTCTKCMDACPTQAIIQPYIVDGSKCISYYTIELKDKLPQNQFPSYQDWIFGCDICQDVCPWNRFSIFHQEADFQIKPQIESWQKAEWESASEEIFEDVFHDSPIKRTGYQGIMKNIKKLREV
jgi:epoxyqueuosine reductase